MESELQSREATGDHEVETRMIFASLSRSLIHLRPGASVGIAEGRVVHDETLTTLPERPNGHRQTSKACDIRDKE